MSEERERVHRDSDAEESQDEVEAHVLDAERNQGTRNQGTRNQGTRDEEDDIRQSVLPDGRPLSREHPRSVVDDVS